MIRIVRMWPFAFLTVLLIFTASGIAPAQTKTADARGPSLSGAASLSPAQIDEIIRKFTAKETEFRKALNDYAFRRDALVQEIGMGGQVVGEYHRVSNFTFDDKGNRFEKIGFFPMPSLQGVSLTTEDLEDLGGVNPFALEGAKAAQYNFKYVGKERIDELDLYVFDVSPKVMPSPKSKERVFVGRIWVDDHDLQIVKAKGRQDRRRRPISFLSSKHIANRSMASIGFRRTSMLTMISSLTMARMFAFGCRSNIPTSWWGVAE